MQHDPWVPEGFHELDQRILIIGHSHHRDASIPDQKNLTIWCVESVILGEELGSVPFFARQPRYMGLDKKSYFRRIALMNFIPEALLHRYEKPSISQIAAGKDRLVKKISELKPTHIFVLTSKLNFGKELPSTVEQYRGNDLNHPTINNGNFPWGTYDIGGRRALVCRLRHPQAARTAEMVEAFEFMLARKP